MNHRWWRRWSSFSFSSSFIVHCYSIYFCFNNYVRKRALTWHAVHRRVWFGIRWQRIEEENCFWKSWAWGVVGVGVDVVGFMAEEETLWCHSSLSLTQTVSLSLSIYLSIICVFVPLISVSVSAPLFLNLLPSSSSPSSSSSSLLSLSLSLVSSFMLCLIGSLLVPVDLNLRYLFRTFSSMNLFFFFLDARFKPLLWVFYLRFFCMI